MDVSAIHLFKPINYFVPWNLTVIVIMRTIVIDI